MDKGLGDGSDEFRLLVELNKDNRWLQENYAEIRERYSDKFIAIQGGKIISAEKDMFELKGSVEKKGTDIRRVLTEFIPKKGVILIL